MSSSPPIPQALLAWAEYWHPIAWKCLLIAGAITAIGACFTLAFLIVQWRAVSIRETQAEWRRSILEYQVAEAKKEETGVRARVAALNSETADLAQKNLSLAQENLSLEQAMQPRQLSSAQIHDIVTAWKAYSGHSVTLWSYAADIEGGALAEQIKNCLIEARIVVVNNIGRMTGSSPPRAGIDIAGSDKLLVIAIHAGLRAIGGLEITEAAFSGADAAESTPTEILVGTKPSAQEK